MLSERPFLVQKMLTKSCVLCLFFYFLSHQQSIFLEGIRIWKRGQGRVFFQKILLTWIIKSKFSFHYFSFLFSVSFVIPGGVFIKREFICTEYNINFLLNKQFQKIEMMIYGSCFRMNSSLDFYSYLNNTSRKIVLGLSAAAGSGSQLLRVHTACNEKHRGNHR